MSIYKFQDSETVVTATSTLGLASSDALLVYCAQAGRTRQATVGSVGQYTVITSATTATTATNISCYGFTSLGSSSSPITGWVLDDPPNAGIKKVIQSISTSTSHTVATVSATINATDTMVGNKIYFRVPGGTVHLTARTTAIWSIDSRTVDIVCT